MRDPDLTADVNEEPIDATPDREHAIRRHRNECAAQTLK